MKKIFQKAFTLVELLIVIAIIGILAVAVLIALDPVEQTNRAQDVKLISASNEIKNALNRYYAANQRFPWCSTTACTAYLNPFTVGSTTYTTCGATFSSFNDSASDTCAEGVLAALVASGDLKASAQPDTRVSLRIFTPTRFAMTYIPSSKAEKVKYVTTVNESGIYTTRGCTALGTATSCPNTSVTCAYCIF